MLCVLCLRDFVQSSQPQKSFAAATDDQRAAFYSVSATLQQSSTINQLLYNSPNNHTL